MQDRRRIAPWLAVAALSLAGVGAASAQTGIGAEPGIVAPYQMVDIEHSDRKQRLMRLSGMEGIIPPEFHETFITPAQHHLRDYPVTIPVLRVVFSDKAFFDFDSDQLRPEGYAVLNVIAESLRRDAPDVAVFIAGYTDAIGSADYNLGLGMRRANAVAAQLVPLGIASARVYTVSFGKDVPIADNDTEEGRARNRRIEFFFAAHLQAITATISLGYKLHCEGVALGGNDCERRYQISEAKPVDVVVEQPRPTAVPLPPTTVKKVEFVDTKIDVILSDKPVDVILK